MTNKQYTVCGNLCLRRNSAYAAQDLQIAVAKYSAQTISPVRLVRKPKKKKTRRMVFMLFFVLIVSYFIFIGQGDPTIVHATGNDIMGQINQNVNENLNNIDFGDIDREVDNIRDGFNLFGEDSFRVRVGRILSGEFQDDHPNMLSALFGLFGGVIFRVLPIVMLIVAIAILSGLLQSFKPESGGDGVKSIINFVSYAAVVTIVMVGITDLVIMVGETLASMKRQMDIIFPILLTLMVAVGGTSSAGVYQPAIALLSNGVMQIFSFVVMPLFIITLVFSVVGHISPHTRLDKFVSFFNSAYKWIVGIVFTVFIAFLTIQGISAGAHDGVSIRAARFTISSYVPYLGGYLSQGFDLVLASSILIKNAVGVAGLYLLFGIVLGPIISIVVFSLGLKLAAAITQPIADERISDFLTTINRSFSMLVSILVGAAFMYFLTIGLIIITGNNII